MTAGDVLIALCIGIAALALLACIAVAAHRSLTAPAERTEYDEYWRRKSER